MPLTVGRFCAWKALRTHGLRPEIDSGNRRPGRYGQGIEAGIPKLRIEEAAPRTQAKIDAGEQIVVGVNKYRLDKEDPIEILDVDNTKVRLSQVDG